MASERPREGLDAELRYGTIPPPDLDTPRMTEQGEYEEYRVGHLGQTAKIWERLIELGANEQSPLDFDFSFTATRRQDAELLREARLS